MNEDNYTNLINDDNKKIQLKQNLDKKKIKINDFILYHKNKEKLNKLFSKIDINKINEFKSDDNNIFKSEEYINSIKFFVLFIIFKIFNNVDF